MIVLGIETSCDETAVAVLRLTGPKERPATKILSNLIASQHEIHAPFGGIFPELASRRHIEVLQPLTEQALQESGVKKEKLDGVAVTHTPGLVGSLLVGLSFAKAFAFGLKIPFIGVSHLEGHLNAPLLENPKIPYPQIGLIVSGGHTALYLIKKFGDYRFLGGTRDDAAGEAFDKGAKLLGLGYPGGPEIDRLARQGDPEAIHFPRPEMPRYDFSFSGLKTALREVRERGVLSEGRLPSPQRGPTADSPPRHPPLPDLCASFQEAIVDHLIEKTVKAAKNYRCKTVVLTGGVACNSRLRVKLGEACKRSGRRLFFPSPIFCTDNGAMIAYVGGRQLLAGRRSPLSLNAVANLHLRKKA